jgi:hypothetical protein
VSGDTPARRLCGAKRANLDATCTRPAGWGTDHPGVGHCKWHGGSTTNQRKAARKEMAARALAELGAEPVPTDPIRGLVDALASANADLIALNTLVAALPAPTDALGVHPLVELRERAIDRLARISKAGADVQLESRWLAFVDDDMRRVVGALDRALGDDGAALTDHQRDALRQAMSRELLAIEAPAWDLTIDVLPDRPALPAPPQGASDAPTMINDERRNQG